jgi:hypothetical protein
METLSETPAGLLIKNPLFFVGFLKKSKSVPSSP